VLDLNPVKKPFTIGDSSIVRRTGDANHLIQGKYSYGAFFIILPERLLGCFGLIRIAVRMAVVELN
jgi:hypothetical protein